MDANKYLCFSLGKDEYAVPLSLIKEVVVVPQITPIPNSPKHFLGFINLRGIVLSIIDLRIKLHGNGDITKDTPAIVVEINHHIYAVVVDSVNQVISPSAENIVDKPDLASESQHSDIVEKVFRQKDSLTLIISLEKALGLVNPSTSYNNAQSAA